MVNKLLNVFKKQQKIFIFTNDLDSVDYGSRIFIFLYFQNDDADTQVHECAIIVLNIHLLLGVSISSGFDQKRYHQKILYAFLESGYLLLY